MLRKPVGPVRRRLLTVVLFAGLALLPSLSWAAREQQRADRGQERGKPAADSRQVRAPEPAATRVSGPERRVGGKVQVAPAPGPERSRGTPPAPAAARPRQERTPVTGGSGRQQAPRSEPYQLHRQPSSSTPARERGSANRTDNGTVRDRQPAQGGDAYQLYRTPRQVASPQASQPSYRVAPRQPSSRQESGDQRQVRERPRAGTRLEQPAGGQRERPQATRPTEGERRQAREQSPSPQQGRAVNRTGPARGERRFSVPEARFRGPESEERVRLVPGQERQQLPTRMRDWVRHQNRQLGRFDQVRPARDVVGNPVPRDAVVLHRDQITNINIINNYTQIVNNYGYPGFSYLVGPGNVWGWNGGFFFGHRSRHSLVVLSFFYPFYFSDPYFFGFYYPGYYPSVYSYFGWSPGWIYPDRVYYAPYDYVYAPATPYRYYYSGYHLDYAGASGAIRDVRRAWLEGDMGPLAAHLTDRLDIRIYFDGEYSYSTTTDDFYAMTLDTLGTTHTVAMDFEDPIWISTREVFYTGRQVFYDPDGERHTVYVSFRLRQLGGDWYLVAVGTSKEPVEHEYTDFRFQ